MDTMLYLIYINKSEEIDQRKQNFSLFSLFIQMTDDLIDHKMILNKKLYYLCKLVLVNLLLA